MKKISIMLIVLFSFVVTTGFTKNSISLNINNDKKVEAILSTNYENEIDEEYLNNYQNRNIQVINNKKEKELKLVKKINGIDEVSSKNGNDNLIKIFLDNPQKQYYFEVNKGFLKNVYTLNINKSEFLSNLKDEYLNLNIDNIFEESKISINFPYKVLNSNALEKSEDGKNLTWDLLDSEETIEVKFEIINLNVAYATLTAIVCFMLLILVTFISTHKPKPKKQVIVNEKTLESNDIGEVDLTNTSLNNKMNEQGI